MVDPKYHKVRLSQELNLHRLSESDAELLQRLYSDKRNVKHMDDLIVGWFGDIGRAKETIKKINASDADLVWVIDFSGDKAGFIGLEHIDKEKKYCELWYLLDPAYQGQGVMIRTVSGLLKFLKSRNDFDTVVATAKTVNERSIRLLKRAGFKRIGTRGEDRHEFRMELNSPTLK